MKRKLPYGHLAALLLFALGASAQDQPPATDVPAFTAQGAFVAIVVIELPSFLNKRQTYSQFAQRIGQNRGAAELPNGLFVDSEELILHLRLASHLP
jgi:hypothetical protein